MDDQARVLIAVTISVAAVIGMWVLAVLRAVKAAKRRSATMLKTTLAERILKSAAKGERNRARLRDAALSEVLGLLSPAKDPWIPRLEVASPL